MITLYHTHPQAGIAQKPWVCGDAPPQQFLWLDMLAPTPEEEREVTQATGVQLPTREQIWKNDTLNRFYEENGVHYLTAAVITKVDTPHPNTSAITFILSSGYLMTLRHVSPTSFKNFSERLLKAPQKFPTGPHLLEGLLEEIITRIAHNSESVVTQLDALSHLIFDRTDARRNKKPLTTTHMKHMLRELGSAADLNSKINESLHSMSRLVSYLPQVQGAKALDKNIRLLAGDVQALIRQTAFLADKITFLLDATLGMINAEQNLIIKMFSIATVFFLPPTLLASVYGMNFEHMPELHNPLGYPTVLVAMGIFAIVPYLVFRRKGWF